MWSWTRRSAAGWKRTASRRSRISISRACARSRIADKRLTAATLIRLVMPQIFAGRYDRVLYLDADVEIRGEIAPLFSLDLAGAPLAAVPLVRQPEDRSPRDRASLDAHCQRVGHDASRTATSIPGVMLIDTARWVAEDLGERVLGFVERNPHLWRLPDEDALNAVLDGARRLALADLELPQLGAHLAAHRQARRTGDHAL